MNVIVIGGGPAGMMAAGRAAELGMRVLLAEKTSRLGTKLLMSGGGRCNITNNADSREFMAAFGKNGKFLSQAFKVFSNQDLFNFLKAHNIELKVEEDGRVFPADNKAESVLAALRRYLENHQVDAKYNSVVTKVLVPSPEHRQVTGVQFADGSVMKAEKVIIATGGKSYPQTGSTGDGYRLAKECGHTIVPLKPGLVPLESDADFIRELQGLTLKNILLSVIVNGKKKKELCGELLFTHFGVSGPKVLILSNMVIDALDEGNKVELALNLKPEFTLADFDRYVQQELKTHGKKTILNYLKKEMPESLAKVFERKSGLNGAKKCNVVTREERRKLVALFTDLRVTITRARPLEEATITRGGVSLKEINSQTMESRLMRGLYFCGEVLAVDGITGGYNLQEAFSTGYLAGQAAAGMEHRG